MNAEVKVRGFRNTLSIYGASQNSGVPFLGVHIAKIPEFGGLCWGLPIYEKCHIRLLEGFSFQDTYQGSGFRVEYKMGKFHGS